MVEFQLVYPVDGILVVNAYAYEEGTGLFYHPFGIEVPREEVAKVLHRVTDECREHLDPVVVDAVLGPSSV